MLTLPELSRQEETHLTLLAFHFLVVGKTSGEVIVELMGEALSARPCFSYGLM